MTALKDFLVYWLLGKKLSSVIVKPLPDQTFEVTVNLEGVATNKDVVVALTEATRQVRAQEWSRQWLHWSILLWALLLIGHITYAFILLSRPEVKVEYRESTQAERDPTGTKKLVQHLDWMGR